MNRFPSTPPKLKDGDSIKLDLLPQFRIMLIYYILHFLISQSITIQQHSTCLPFLPSSSRDDLHQSSEQA